MAVMHEPTPNGMIHLVDKDAPEMHEKVSRSLNQAGHPVTADGVNPSDDSNIKNIQDFIEKTAGHAASSVGTAFSGEEPFPIETASGSNVVSILNKKRGI